MLRPVMSPTVRLGLLSAYRRLLQPLIRILIRNGVSYYEFNEVVKSVYVEVAERDFAIAGRKSSQSRIAILTGFTRKEVARQKALLDSGTLFETTSNLNKVTRVLVGWHSDPEFTGPYGMPIELPFDAGAAPSFSHLVRKYCGDVSPLEMLEELIRVGAVEKSSSGLYKVLMRTYIPERLNPDALERFGEVVRNFIETYEYNIETQEPSARRFERIVFADDGLRASLMPAFEQLIRTKGLQLLVELDNWLSAQELTPGAKNKSEPRVRTGLGIYHFIDERSDQDK